MRRIAIILLLVATAHATSYYVSQSGAGSKNGSQPGECLVGG
jgi:hypothetical protein